MKIGPIKGPLCSRMLEGEFMRKELEKDFTQLKALAEKILDQINEQMSCLRKKEEEFEANHKKLVEFSQRKVKLDVGGKLFSTTLTTLTKEECFFSAMFSGHFPLEKDEEDGSYHVDRNPLYFETILDYLRTGRLQLSKYSSEEMEELRHEAEFYQIPSLLALLPTPKAAFQPCEGFVLSDNNTVSKFTGSDHHICPSDKPVKDYGEWTFVIDHACGYNDRVGFILSSELTQLQKELETCALYLCKNPGTFFLVAFPVRVVSPLAVQVCKGDRVRFVVSNQATEVKVHINGILSAEFALPAGNTIYPAWGTKNRNSQVRISTQ